MFRYRKIVSNDIRNDTFRRIETIFDPGTGLLNTGCRYEANFSNPGERILLRGNRITPAGD